MPHAPAPLPRIHVALAVRDVDQSRRFYDTLFDATPVKTRPGYVKYSLAQPALNLSLNAAPPTGSVSHGATHFGIELPTSDAVLSAQQRLVAAGLSPAPEMGVTCCYAVQDKAWVTDPDGNDWELFTVLEDAEEHGKLPEPAAAEGSCCAPACCSQD